MCCAVGEFLGLGMPRARADQNARIIASTSLVNRSNAPRWLLDSWVALAGPGPTDISISRCYFAISNIYGLINLTFWTLWTFLGGHRYNSLFNATSEVRHLTCSECHRPFVWSYSLHLSTERFSTSHHTYLWSTYHLFIIIYCLPSLSRHLDTWSNVSAFASSTSLLIYLQLLTFPYLFILHYLFPCLSLLSYLSHPYFYARNYISSYYPSLFLSLNYKLMYMSKFYGWDLIDWYGPLVEEIWNLSPARLKLHAFRRSDCIWRQTCGRWYHHGRSSLQPGLFALNGQVGRCVRPEINLQMPLGNSVFYE